MINNSTNINKINNHLLPQIIEHIRINPNIIKFKLLMTSTSKIELQKLCRFVRIVNKGVSTPG